MGNTNIQTMSTHAPCPLSSTFLRFVAEADRDAFLRELEDFCMELADGVRDALVYEANRAVHRFVTIDEPEKDEDQSRADGIYDAVLNMETASLSTVVQHHIKYTVREEGDAIVADKKSKPNSD